MRTLVAIPVYNHGATVLEVVRRTCVVHPEVLVVDDGSTDLGPDFERELAAAGVALVRHPRNRGKGAALRTALTWAREHGFDYLATIDADGQHDPGDLPRLLAVAAAAAPEPVLVVGCRDFSGPGIPEKSRRGREIANFWLRVECGADCADCQSGFRLYPVAALAPLKFLGHGYNFEAEVLTRAVWAGIVLRNVPVRVHYPPPGERVSHFRLGRDNLALGLMHFHLVGLRLLPLPRRGSWRAVRSAAQSLRHPLRLLRALLAENCTPGGLAAAAAVGTLLAVIPIPGFHSAAIVYATLRLHLNKVMALAIQNLFMPPFTPFLCIELGYFLRYGRWLTEFNFDTVVRELGFRLWEWLLGSLVLAPLFAAVVFVLVYATTAWLQRRRSE